jgi:hypothetical protein
VSTLSEARIARIAHLVLEGLRSANLVDCPSHPAALRESKKILTDFFNRDSALDAIVRQKIRSLSRPVPPGSREWDILYRKYREEEMKKHKEK